MEHEFDIADLIYRYNTARLTDEENALLIKWVKEDTSHEALFNRLTDPELLLSKLEIYEQFDHQRVWNNLQNQITSDQNWNWHHLYRYAAILLIPIIASVVWVVVVKKSEPTPYSQLDEIVVPGTEKAILLLADGAQLALVPDQPAQKIQQGNAAVTTTTGELTYEMNEEDFPGHHEISFNTLTTPRGGTFHVRLSDGTRVWLNAGSSLRYPTSFDDSVRQVFLSGEAYFDVASTRQPFIVATSYQHVRVVGTEFNISSYEEEPAVTTTLVEGEVVVQDNQSGAELVMRPSDQVVFTKSDRSTAKSRVNPTRAVSWVLGQFVFDNDDLDVIMRKLSRWYDFTYQFEAPIAQGYHFSGRIAREEKISSVLEMLELTTNVRFDVKESTILINKK